MQLGLDMEPNTRRWEASEVAIYHLIRDHVGKSSAVSAPQLSRETGTPDRELRDIIKRLVEKRGVAICSCTHGYFMPASEDEILEAMHTYLSWGLSAVTRASRLKRSRRLAQLAGQLELELKKVQPAAKCIT